ncbi:hypothetical protein [Legionella taurinensis]|uniref:Uncharacterized protein n=1 Tax=Legionella taurinensis TaxID=70611 RepID=A0A3A5L195_9GAMM|nr:hypothetical protein [Legionella taurinensis]RJT43961.1 hypothetical protein D6J04_13225 [Legionella taurinensis]RJT64984.1 hypothetical protein D6J03_13540 [Legionella taurinensis]STY27178.1 Uncharacterised protein [Legionella taurinensis]
MKLTTIYHKHTGTRAIIDFSESSFLRKVEFVYDARTLTFTLFHQRGETEKQQSINSYFMEGLISLLLKCSGHADGSQCPTFSFAQVLPPAEVLDGHDSLFGEDNIHAHDPHFSHSLNAHNEYPHFHIEYAAIDAPYPVIEQILQLLVDFDYQLKNAPSEASLFCRLSFSLVYQQIIKPSHSPLEITLPLQTCIEHFSANDTGASQDLIDETKAQAGEVFAIMENLAAQPMLDVDDVPSLVNTMRTEITEQSSREKAREENERKQQLERQKRNRQCSFLFFGAAALTAAAFTVNYMADSGDPSSTCKL